MPQAWAKCALTLLPVARMRVLRGNTHRCSWTLNIHHINNCADITIMVTASLTETSDAQTHKQHLDCDQSASISVRLFVMSSSGGLSLLLYYRHIHTLHKMWHWDTQGELRARHNTCSGHHWSMYAEEQMDTNRFIHSKAPPHIKNRPFCGCTQIPVNTHIGKSYGCYRYWNPTLCMHSVIIHLIYHSEQGAEINKGRGRH